MIKDLRKQFNEQFTEAKYATFLSDIEKEFNYKPTFRIAESPVFIPDPLRDKIVEACQDIIDFVNADNFKELTRGAIKHPISEVPAEDYISRFLQFDFGITCDENGEYIPQLIELQGFPSLYFYQDFLSLMYRKHFDIPSEYSVHLGGLRRAEYLELLKKEIVGDTDPKQVVLLEVEPEKQNTRIDFLCANFILGIKILCISKLKKRGRELYYKDENGKEIKILKVYNRVIFDELIQRTDIKREFSFKDEVDVDWVGHPNWFFRISKFTMPLLKGKYVPPTYYLDQLEEYPENLDQYVLKPLYSFSGTGVQLNLNREMLDNIKNKENYIIQKKITYERVIQTPNEPARCEVRMMALNNPEDKKARLVSNLVRLSKGEMVGVKYNKDKDWVGGSLAYFRSPHIGE